MIKNRVNNGRKKLPTKYYRQKIRHKRKEGISTGRNDFFDGWKMKFTHSRSHEQSLTSILDLTQRIMQKYTQKKFSPFWRKCQPSPSMVLICSIKLSYFTEYFWGVFRHLILIIIYHSACKHLTSTNSHISNSSAQHTPAPNWRKWRKWQKPILRALKIVNNFAPPTPRHKKRNAALAPAGDEHTESMPDLLRNGHPLLRPLADGPHQISDADFSHFIACQRLAISLITTQSSLIL